MKINITFEEDFTDFIKYIKNKYPNSLLELSGLTDQYIDLGVFSEKYFDVQKDDEITIDPNANVFKNSIANYHNERFKGISKLYSLYKLWEKIKEIFGVITAKRILENEIIKNINMQDSHLSYMPYCWAFDCYDLIIHGLPFIKNLPSSPPKHADSFLRHVEQLAMFASHQLLGATAIPNVLVIYSELLKNDSENKDYPVPNYKNDNRMFDKYIEQEFQKFIYTLNQPVRYTQSLFTNITLFDNIFLDELCKKYIINDEFIDPVFVMYIQKKFVECFNNINKSNLLTFPVITAQFKINDENNIEDEDFYNFIAEQNIEFANINIFTTHNLTALSSCCRLISNIEDIIQVSKEENMNLIGGSSLKVGSAGVVTLNLARIGLLSDDKDEFLIRIKNLTDDAFKLNHCRRELIKELIEKNQLPLYKYDFINLDNQYNTLGINGLNEALEFMGLDIVSDEAKNFTIELLKYLQNLVDKQIREYGYRCNIEQIPAESTAIKFAKADRILYKQDKHFIYSNQFIPLLTETNIINRIELQALFENYFSGGTILHINVADKINSFKVMKKLMSYIIKSGVQYFAINYFFSECENKHITINNQSTCSICGAKIIENYTRIVGFLTPISTWQKERKDEFHQRKKYIL